MENAIEAVTEIQIRFGLRAGTEYVTLKNANTLNSGADLNSPSQLHPVDKLPKDGFVLSLESREDYWITYRLDTNSRIFSSHAWKLSSEYLSYIDAKLSLSDAELSNYMTGTYPAEEDSGLGGEGLSKDAGYACLYPKHLEMMGRFNSVFGADLDWFTDGERLRSLIVCGDLPVEIVIS